MAEVASLRLALLFSPPTEASPAAAAAVKPEPADDEEGRLGGLVDLPALTDRLPPALRSAALRIDARAAVVGLVLGLVAATAGLAYLMMGRGDGGGAAAAPAAAVLRPGSPVSGAKSSGAPKPKSGASAATTASAGGEVVVDIEGRVARPGIQRLPAGARVVDALTAAGGAAAGVDTTALNLARPLSDGEQLLVGVLTVAPAAGTSATPGGAGGGSAAGGVTVDGKVNLNTATLDQLEQLPGVGPVLAQRILDWREANGHFSSVDELREVSGIGEKKFADMAAKALV